MIEPLLERLDRIERILLDQKVMKEHYSVAEVAERLGKKEWTVADWARRGRIKAEKKRSGRGKYQAWVVSHTELLRIEREGLLPERGR